MNAIRTNIIRTSLAAAVTVMAVPAGLAAAAEPGLPEYGVIERQCDAHQGSFFVNAFDGLNLICSAPKFDNGAMPAQMACERIGGTFRLIGRDQPVSWGCHVAPDA